MKCPLKSEWFRWVFFCGRIWLKSMWGMERCEKSNRVVDNKIYKELVRQNETIFEAEKERNALEEKQGSLKGLSKLTKKGELQGEIDRINERIDLLKVGLSGIAKRYGYQTVQDFYRAYHAAQNVYADYQDKAAKWEKTMEQRQRVIQCITEYRIIKKRLQKDNLIKLRIEMTKGRDNRSFCIMSVIFL